MRAARAAVIVGLLLLSGYVAASGSLWFQSSDFFCLYHAGRGLISGHDPYDAAWWATISGAVVPAPTFRGGEGLTSCAASFAYPLWTAVAMIPFAALPLEPAAVLWAAASIAATIVGIVLAWNAMAGARSLAALFATVVIASPSFWLLLISGQLTGVELGLAGVVAYALSRGANGVAGAALAAMTLKPQLVAASVPVIAVRGLARERRVFVGGAVALAAMTLAAVAFIPDWPVQWLGEIAGRRLRVATLLPTAWGFAADVFGNALVGAALVVILLATLWLLLRGRSLSMLDLFVLSLPVSLFVTPHAWSYDHLVLAPCWAYLIARAAMSRARVGVLVSVALVAVALPWILYAIAFARGGETLTAVIPAIAAVLVASSMRSATESYAPNA